jgi:ABC-type glycerol-3-phosphate transport system substrate-binding protein
MRSEVIHQLLWGVLFVLLSISCQQSDLPAGTNALPALELTIANQTPTPTSVAASAESSQDRPLTVWLPARFMPAPASTEEASFSEALQQFEQQYPALPVEVYARADEGQAGLLNYLRSAQRVAPAILPDVVLLDTQQLWRATELGLIKPLLNGEFSQPDTFYPFALDAVKVNGELHGFPYFADAIHLVYKRTSIATPPVTWEEMLATGQRFLFPGAGHGGLSDEWLLLQYVSAGGTELGETSVANREALGLLFTFLAESRAQDVVPPQTLTLSEPTAVWSTLAIGEGEMASLSAHTFRSLAVSTEEFGFAPLPGRQGAEQTVAQVWAFAILTDDTQRRSLATALIHGLLAPTVQGRWSFSAYWLPTQPAAMQEWNTADPYSQFIDQQLHAAIALPGSPAFAEFAKQLQQTQSAILNGEMTPEQAVAEFR